MLLPDAKIVYLLRDGEELAAAQWIDASGDAPGLSTAVERELYELGKRECGWGSNGGFQKD